MYFNYNLFGVTEIEQTRSVTENANNEAGKNEQTASKHTMINVHSGVTENGHADLREKGHSGVMDIDNSRVMENRNYEGGRNKQAASKHTTINRHSDGWGKGHSGVTGNRHDGGETQTVKNKAMKNCVPNLAGNIPEN